MLAMRGPGTCLPETLHPERARDGTLKTLRFFISSPGDVFEERALASRVIERLQGEYIGRVVLEPVLWEHEPLVATSTFQHADRQAVRHRRRRLDSLVASRDQAARAVQARGRIAIRIRHRVRIRGSDRGLSQERQAGPARLSQDRAAVRPARRREGPDGAARAEEEARSVRRQVVSRQGRRHARRRLPSLRVAERLRDPAREPPPQADRSTSSAECRRDLGGARGLEEGLAVPRTGGVRVRARAGVLRQDEGRLRCPEGAARAGRRGSRVRADPRHERRRQVVRRPRRRSADADEAGRHRGRRALATRGVQADGRSRRSIHGAREGTAARACAALARHGGQGARRACADIAGIAAGGDVADTQCLDSRGADGGQAQRPARAGRRSDGGDVHAGGDPVRASAVVLRGHRCAGTKRAGLGHLHAAQRLLSAACQPPEARAR